MGGPGSGPRPQGIGAGGFDSKPKRRRVATENAITKANPSEPKRALFHCAYCSKDISGVVRIKCAECAEVNLCVECFSAGVEPHPHKACHAYHVVDNLSFPLFTLDWGADEELLLLEAVEMYGLGNWTEVSEHVGTKSKLQCHAHYFETYVNSPTAPLPDMSKVLGKEYAREEPKEEPKEKKRKTGRMGRRTRRRTRRRRRWRPSLDRATSDTGATSRNSRGLTSSATSSIRSTTSTRNCRWRRWNFATRTRNSTASSSSGCSKSTTSVWRSARGASSSSSSEGCST